MKWAGDAADAITTMAATLPPHLAEALVRSAEREARNSSADDAMSLAHVYAVRSDDPAIEAAVRPSPPQQLTYEPADTPVACVAASPFHRHLFATAGRDGVTRIYTAMHSAPILAFEHARGSFTGAGNVVHASALSWSATSPCVLAAGLTDGRVLVFDLFETTAGPTMELRSDGGAVNLLSGELRSPRPLIGTSSTGPAGQGPEAGSSPPTTGELLFDGSVTLRPVTRATSGATPAGSTTAEDAAAAVTSVTFHPSLPGLLIACNGDGTVLSWWLGPTLGGPRKDEDAALTAFMASVA